MPGGFSHPTKGRSVRATWESNSEDVDDGPHPVSTIPMPTGKNKITLNTLTEIVSAFSLKR